MSYLDRAKWRNNEEVRRVAKYLKETKHLITPNGMSDLYFNAPGNTATSVMTAILLDSGINPLKYISYIPEYYGMGLFIGDLILPNHIRIIGEHAFESSNIEAVHIPEGAYRIEYGAFAMCSYLSDIYLPNSIVKIEDNAFHHCEELSSIHYNGTLKEFDDIDVDVSSAFGEIYTPIHLICIDGEDTL